MLKLPGCFTQCKLGEACIYFACKHVEHAVNEPAKPQFDIGLLLDELCKEQMKEMLQVGKWIRYPETVHELYAHLAQYIGNLAYLIVKYLIILF